MTAFMDAENARLHTATLASVRRRLKLSADDLAQPAADLRAQGRGDLAAQVDEAAALLCAVYGALRTLAAGQVTREGEGEG